jgi:hydrogenase/urease accessory protein HupE
MSGYSLLAGSRALLKAGVSVSIVLMVSVTQCHEYKGMSTHAEVEGTSASVTINLAATDAILLAPEHDRNRDGRISRTEYESGRADLVAGVAGVLKVSALGQVLEAKSSGVEIESTEPFSDEPHALRFNFTYAAESGKTLEGFRLDPNIFRSIKVSPITGKPVVGAARNTVTVLDHGKNVTFIATGREVYDPRTVARQNAGIVTAGTSGTVNAEGAMQANESDEDTVAIGASSIVSLMAHFLKEGVIHILIGWDHVLFVVGLILLANSLRSLVTVITAFTVAHSITLILTSLNVLRVDQPQIVEAIIAASVAYVGLENLIRVNKTVNWRWVLVFAFGLLHGMGFAGVLAELLGEEMKGASRGQLVACLLTFNVGVELGQLLIIAILFPLLVLLRKNSPVNLKRVVIAGSVVVMFMGVSFLLDRTLIPGRLFYVEWFNG